MKLYVVMESDKKVLWRDDFCDWETINKAEDFMTSKGLLVTKEEVDFHGDKVFWVRKL